MTTSSSRPTSTTLRSRWSTAARCASSSRSATRGRARSGCGRWTSSRGTNPGTGRCAATATPRTRGPRTATPSDRPPPHRLRRGPLTAGVNSQPSLSRGVADEARSEDRRMGILQHLEELRKRFQSVFLVFIIVFVLTLAFDIRVADVGGVPVPYPFPPIYNYL